MESSVSVYFSSVCLISIRQQLRTSVSACFCNYSSKRAKDILWLAAQTMFIYSIKHFSKLTCGCTSSTFIRSSYTSPPSSSSYTQSYRSSSSSTPFSLRHTDQQHLELLQSFSLVYKITIWLQLVYSKQREIDRRLNRISPKRTANVQMLQHIQYAGEKRPLLENCFKRIMFPSSKLNTRFSATAQARAKRNSSWVRP